ncbi:NAD(P)-dependent oxidoreductase [Siccirubricoccus deserti]
MLVVSFGLDTPARSVLAEELGPDVEVVALSELNAADRHAALRRASVLLARNTGNELRQGEAGLLGAAKLIQFMTAGVDYIPLRALPAAVPIASNGGAYAEPMAEHALAMALAAAKRLFIEQAELSRNVFNQFTVNRMLAGGVCGILGFGGIGVATARLMRALGMRIHAIRRGTVAEGWIGSARPIG